MSDDGGNALLYALLLILPISALAARRLPLGHVAKMAAAWIVIFAIGLVLVALASRAGWLTMSVTGTAVRMPKSNSILHNVYYRTEGYPTF